MARKQLRFIFVLALTSLLAFATIGAARAAKGGRTSSTGSSLSLVLLNSTDGSAHYGQQVTFKVSTTATDQPFVELDCYQSGDWVYWASAGFFPSYPWQWAQDFTLRSDHWTGGAAQCSARLYYVAGNGRTRTLATLDFDAAA